MKKCSRWTKGKFFFSVVLVVALVLSILPYQLLTVEAGNEDWDVSLWDSEGWIVSKEDGKTVYTADSTHDNMKMTYSGSLKNVTSVEADMRYNVTRWGEASSGIFLCAAGGAEWFADYRADANAVRLRRNGEYKTYVNLENVLAPDDWAHWQVKWDEEKLYIYIEGELVLNYDYAAFGDEFTGASKCYFYEWGQPMSLKNITVGNDFQEDKALDEAFIPEGSSGTGNASEGWILDNINDNNMLVIPYYMKSFTLEADAQVLDGDWALGLAFGIPDKDRPTADFMAAHVNPGRGNTWMFRKTDQAGLNYGGSLAGIDVTRKMHLKLVVRGTTFRFYVNDMETPNVEGSYAGYAGGYVGLMCALTKVQFTNVALKDSQADMGLSLDEAFLSEGSSGTGNASEGWTLDNINDNNMLVIPYYMKSFTLEADAQVLDGDWALGLAFGIPDKDRPTADFMAVHVNPSRGNTWMFRKTDQAGLNYGGSLAGIDVTQKMHLKLVVRGTTFRFYVNDMETPNVEGSYADYIGGYVGLMCALTKVQFTNVVLKGTPQVPPVVKGIIVPSGSRVYGNPDDGYVTANLPGRNNFGVFDIYAETLEFETDLEFVSNDLWAAGILFGVDDPKTCSKWSAVHLQAFNDGLRIFSDFGGVDQTVLLPDVNLRSKNRLKLTIDENNLASIYVNDMDNPRMTVIYPDYKGGYVGFCSALTEAKFSNYKITAGRYPEAEQREMDLGTAHGTGITVIGENSWSVKADTGENIAVFEPQVTAFSYEALVRVPQGKNTAAGLIFGEKEPQNAKPDYTVMKLMPEKKQARIYSSNGRFEQILDLTNVDFTELVPVKVEMDLQKQLTVFVGDMSQPVLKTSYTGYMGGRVGLFSENGTSEFQDVKLSGIAYPKLSSLKLIGADMDQEFSPENFHYHATVDKDVTSVKLMAEVPDGMTLIIANKVMQSGQESEELTLEPGYNALLVRVGNERYQTTYNMSVYRQFDENELYQESSRPKLRYSASHHWVNDPNGLVYNESTGEYHMFYQYNPYSSGMGNCSWGHAVSRDLIHWQELPVAIYANENGVIASGSCVIDEKNTSGLFDDTVLPGNRMVAMFTHNSEFRCQGGVGPFGMSAIDAVNGRQEQSLAYSKDGGITWNLYDGNPVLRNEGYSTYGIDFRDPKILWMEDESLENGGIWMMVVAGGCARIYTSPDLIHWTFNSEALDADGNRIYSECPDLFPLTTEDGETKWIYMGYNAPAEYYYVGNMTKKDGYYQFRAETAKQRYNGVAAQATQSFYNDAKGRRIQVSWVDDGGLGFPDKKWVGTQSIPLEAKLVKQNGSYKLASYPVEELASLRQQGPVAEWKNTRISGESRTVFKEAGCRTYDIEAIIDPGSAEAFGLKIYSGNTEQIVKYDVAGRKMLVASNLNNGALDLTPMNDGKVKLRVLTDTYLTDAFGNDGMTNFTFGFIPNTFSGEVKVEFFAEGGNAVVDSLTAYRMDSAWKGALPPQVTDNEIQLENLRLSEKLPSLDFKADVTEYSLKVENAVDSISIMPTYTGRTAVLVNGTAVASGEYSKELALTVGKNTIVVAAGERVYSIIVTRAGEEKPEGPENPEGPGKPEGPENPEGPGKSDESSKPSSAGDKGGLEQGSPKTGDGPIDLLLIEGLAGVLGMMLLFMRKRRNVKVESEVD